MLVDYGGDYDGGVGYGFVVDVEEAVSEGPLFLELAVEKDVVFY